MGFWIYGAKSVFRGLGYRTIPSDSDTWPRALFVANEGMNSGCDAPTALGSSPVTSQALHSKS